MPPNYLILCHLLLFPPWIFPSIRVFSNESLLRIRWPKYIGVSGSALVLTMNIQDWIPLGWTGWISLLSKGLLSPLQHHSLKASVQPSTFFIVQLSHPYMATGKTIALTRWTFADKVMSLLFNMLSKLVMAFLPRSKRLLISWLQSLSAVLLEPPKIKSVTVSTVSPLFAMKWWDQMPWSQFSECWVLSQLFHSLFHLHQEAL